jgi:hypothetical protein
LGDCDDSLLAIRLLADFKRFSLESKLDVALHITEDGSI